jgi:hypothetical protein
MTRFLIPGDWMWFSIANLILNLFGSPRIVQIRRFPPAKRLHPHLLGLALALGLVLVAAALHLTDLVVNLGAFIPGLLLAIFVAGTWVGGPFILLTAVLYFVPTPTPFATIWTSIIFLSKPYFAAYAFGAVFAAVYNDVIFFYFVVISRDSVRIAFAFDTSRTINIIKSPNKKEEEAFEALLLAHPELEEQRLYRDQWETPPRFPYTMVFVANPKIRKRRLSVTDPEFEPDPIIQNLDLFLHSIDRALRSFEEDHVLGCLEVWSRVRIVAIFDPDLDFALAQEFQDDFTIDGKVAENLLDTTDNMPHKIGELLQQHPVGLPSPLTLCDVDVIYVVSASPTHDRSTARYSDYLDVGETATCDRSTGQAFQFDPDPLGTKTNSGVSEINAARCGDPGVRCEHDDFARSPGRVALSVLGARKKTFIHEFAHAMSSALRGAIVDEYADVFILQSAKSETQLPATPFYINRIERIPIAEPRFIPVHSIFARYQHIDFLSDLAHPSAEADWLGYFPERHDSYCPCTMDRTGDEFRFDRLISNFMYDRICAKLNRPH